MKNLIIAGVAGTIAGTVAGVFGHRALARRQDAKMAEQLGLLPQHEVLAAMAAAEKAAKKAAKFADRGELNDEEKAHKGRLEEAASAALEVALDARRRCRSALPEWTAGEQKLAPAHNPVEALAAARHEAAVEAEDAHLRAERLIARASARASRAEETVSVLERKLKDLETATVVEEAPVAAPTVEEALVAAMGQVGDVVADLPATEAVAVIFEAAQAVLDASTAPAATAEATTEVAPETPAVTPAARKAAEKAAKKAA